MKQNLLVAWRYIVKNKSYSLISVASLSLGLFLFFLIVVWVKDEQRYDSEFSDQTYRVETDLLMPEGGSSKLQTVGWPVGNTILEKIPEAEAVTYMLDWSPVIRKGTSYLFEDALYADNSFLNVMGFSLEEGDPATALREPYSIVITPEFRDKMFGKGSALNKTITINDTLIYRVTGVFAGLPAHSHLRFDLVGSFSTFCAANPNVCEQEFANGWFDVNVYNYIKLRSNVLAETVQAKIKNIVLTAGASEVEKTGFKAMLRLMPAADIYLESGLPTGKGKTGSAENVRLFLLIGILILFIAALNFINLATSRSAMRAKEIGIRKTLGSSRQKLIVQFLVEAGMLCFTAAIIGAVLAAAALSTFNGITGKMITLSDLYAGGNLLLLLIIVLILIPLAGFYPAMVLSAFRPIVVLRGKSLSSGIRLRKAFVVLQFTVSTGFIIGTLIVWKQIHYMESQPLGFRYEHVLLVDASKVPWNKRNAGTAVFKNEIRGMRGTQHVTACFAVPGRTGWGSQFAYPEGRLKEQGLVVEYIPVDAGYLNTIGLKLVAGRDFIENSALDEEESFIINEQAVKAFGWKGAADAIGKKLNTSGKEGKIVGVLKNYHQHGLQQEINPVVLSVAKYITLFAFHYDGISDVQATANAKIAWEKTYPGYPFESRFMQDDYEREYQKEEKLKKLFSVAACFAIIIASIGLFAMSMYTTQARIKEISVRKVLGASLGQITALMLWDFLKLVVIAIGIALPCSFWIMSNWLEDFAYRTNPGILIFAASALLVIVLAVLTVAFRVIDSAQTNPVKNLRTE